MLSRRRSFIPVALFSAAMGAGLLVPAFVGVAAAASGKPSLDLCVVEPGFATPGDSFALHTTGPKSFDNTATLKASACGSYSSLPASGTYTVTQSQTASGWHLCGIYCYSVGSANNANGTVDLSSSSTTVKVSGPASCIFAEVQGGGSSSSGGSSGSFSGGSGSSSSTTTTTKSGTTPSTVHHLPIQSICVAHPSACTFKAS